jgi:2-isopropylmalate synthase
VLGKHSGRHALDARLRQLGYKLNADQLKMVYSRFVAAADEKKLMSDDELLFIVESNKETPSAI